MPTINDPKLRKLYNSLASSRPAPKKTSSLPSATVEMFLHVLGSKLTQQDEKEMRQEMKRGGRGNIYRLGLLLEAKGKVEKDVASYLKRDDPDAMRVLEVSLRHNFTSNFPPLKNMLKQIDAWTTRGKKPSLIG